MKLIIKIILGIYYSLVFAGYFIVYTWVDSLGTLPDECYLPNHTCFVGPSLLNLPTSIIFACFMILPFLLSSKERLNHK